MRKSGILLHITSLPNEYGIGTFGKGAYDFVDFLKKSNQKLWQVLPLGPTSYGDSPYQTFSAFAGNPYFIDYDVLCEEGLLLESEYSHLKVEDQTKVDYAYIYNTKFDVLRLAYNRFDKESEEYVKFKKENDWLVNYSLFMAIKLNQPEGNWFGWAECYKTRDIKALNQFKKEHKDEIEFWSFCQYEFFKQWLKLKKYANDNGIKIIGDIPIYVAYDSCDVWSDPFNWNIDENLNPIDVAGCPPDVFSTEGQLWGNPIYNYERHKANGYKWWIKRVSESLKLYDYLRIDHFRGFAGYYSIPFGAKNAVIGEWKVGPGYSLFKAIERKLGKQNIIAEDLGFLTDDVYDLLAKCGYPGMKILQFGFEEDVEEGTEYAPHNLTKNSIVYTGTHDNSTVLGYYKGLSSEAKKYVLNYLDLPVNDWSENDVTRKMIIEAYKSVCDTCIIPMQDILNLDDSARFNIPSTVGGNWTWRCTSDAFNEDLVGFLSYLTRVYKR